ncbi:MAG: hypothetical protein BroJett018_12400 [Chloroflexota bacterium]|nr:hypothetical protein [Chloroflexota bacterium]NOG64555.1 hypothetical protein [Chloroflexota bacterium]GIK63446.1 MAG: hypothetical protein BroJett018_12400 [Chloroflexota bacterium]
MPVILAENAELQIEEGRWRLYDSNNPDSMSAMFEVNRGSGILSYSATFGEKHGLPGTRLAMHYIKSVVVGFDQKTNRWRLGLYVAYEDDQKPQWSELVHWPTGQNREYADAAQRAGRILAEYVMCPLKLFGVTKTPSAARATITGPVVSHRRIDVEPSEVKARAQQVQLPKQIPGMWLGVTNKGLTTRLSKDATSSKGGEVAPAFQICEVDVDRHVLRLTPATGLLGAFFGGASGRNLKFDEIRNLEFRHLMQQSSHMQKSEEDGLMVEILTHQDVWEVYVTTANEAILIARTLHSRDSSMSRQRVQDVAGGAKIGEQYDAAVGYYRQHEEDQRQFEASRDWAYSVAVTFAGAMNCRMVETEVGDDISALNLEKGY